MAGARVLPPLPPPLPVPFPDLHRLRGPLVWGFGFSLVVHALLAPLAGAYRRPDTERTEVSVVTLEARTTISIPSPTPRPTPSLTPTPRPVATAAPSHRPEPASARSAAPAARLKLNVYKSFSKSGSASAENRYRGLPGVENGVPAGTRSSESGSAAPAAGASPAPVAAAATPATPPPPPACAVARQQARVLVAADAGYPESARENRVTGDVDVLVSLAADGTVTGARIFHTSWNGALDASAIRAARESTYVPEMVDCTAVAGSYLFHVSFTAGDAQ